jgi:hypothetical protein
MLVTMYLESSSVASRNILPPKGSKQLVNFGSALFYEIAAFRSRTLVAELLERGEVPNFRHFKCLLSNYMLN